jgi:hypothetical protein
VTLRALPRRLPTEDGTAVVEFSLVSVVAFLLLFGMAELGIIIFGNTVGANAARDGARAGIVNYVDADVPGSANNLAIVSAVKRRLSGMIVYQSALVACRPADDLDATEPCRPGHVDLGRGDLIEVLVTWEHRGASRFVSDTTHHATARMVIEGAPDLSTTPTSVSTTTTAPGPTTTTTSAPAGTMVAAQMADADHDGRVDQVLVTFSHALAPGCTAGWTLAHVPSSGSLAGVSVSGSTATLTIAEGPGPLDTAVGAFTVSFGGCAGTPAFGPAVPADAAGPVFSSLSDHGGVDGRPEAGDVLALRFSEELVPTWGPTTTVAVTWASHGNTNVELSIPSLVSGTTFGTGSPDYVAKNATVSFNNSVLSVSGPFLTLTLGSACTGCSDTATGQGSFSFTPAGTIRDAAGYLSIAPITAANHRLF